MAYCCVGMNTQTLVHKKRCKHFYINSNVNASSDKYKSLFKVSVVWKSEGNDLDICFLLIYAFSHIQRVPNGRIYNLMVCRAVWGGGGEDTLASYHRGITNSSDKAVGHASLDVDRASAVCNCTLACPSALRLQIMDPSGIARDHSRLHNAEIWGSRAEAQHEDE